MLFHTYGKKENKAVILIHGMLTPWQIWNTAVKTFKKDYYVVVPELDAHTEISPTVFHSIEEEAAKIHDYVLEELGGKVFLLAGLSMGGRIAATITKSEDISIENLVLDGAPLAKMNVLMRAIMKVSYKSIILKSKKHEAKTLERAKKNFLPEDMLPYYIKIAENMIMVSVNNMIDSVFSKFDFSNFGGDTNILFMHGTKGNEMVSRKCALKMKKANPQTEIKCYDGFAHAELACFKPEQWVQEVGDFIK
ncbi:MAG: alpha/beta hydrolase [Lachnospiraceae bacterium]|nr:alpha/beta hydrolase [Lachnospiraceae bacterium]